MIKLPLTNWPASAALALVMTAMLAGCSAATKKTTAGAAFPNAAFDSTYTNYTRLLSAVVRGRLVDYAALKTSQAELEQVVADFGALESDKLAAMPNEAKTAFYINAYNAITLLSVTENYPVRSIKDISGVWNKRKWTVAGQELTLDDIEHKRLRKELSEARIHFAVNCASIGCPPLAPVPYLPHTLSDQLDESCRAYFNDTTLTWLDSRSKKLNTSKIFDWFGGDFKSFPLGPGVNKGLSKKEAAIVSFIASFLPEKKAAQLLSQTRSLKYLSYDWGLNDIER
ncbi:MAG: DUF547 domain-containing protein [candidate division Zixibacteria bacterium]|nr:DUF547 domain-containing protein [candidate division Zixibacteria bacterium]